MRRKLMTDPLTVSRVKTELQRVLRNELDDCERALRNDDVDRARRELDDAITKIKRLASLL
jgi:hypothetical protein